MKLSWGGKEGERATEEEVSRRIEHPRIQVNSPDTVPCLAPITLPRNLHTRECDNPDTGGWGDGCTGGSWHLEEVLHVLNGELVDGHRGRVPPGVVNEAVDLPELLDRLQRT